MARQASEFRQVQRPIQEAFIRPIFQKPQTFTNLPDVRIQSSSIQNTTVNFEIRPPIGVIWELLFARATLTTFTSPSAGSKTVVRIQVTNDSGTTWVELDASEIDQGETFNFGDIQATFTATGTPLLMSNSRYIRLQGTSDSTAGTQTAQFIAFSRVI